MIGFMKYIFLSVVLFPPACLQAQSGRGDKQGADTAHVRSLINMARRYYFNDPDSCLFYAIRALDLSQKIKYNKGKVESMNIAGEAYRFLGNFPRSLEMQLNALQAHRKNKDIPGEMSTLTFI